MVYDSPIKHINSCSGMVEQIVLADGVDVTTRMHQAIMAPSMGALVAVVINNELNSENWAVIS